ncbi:hypothetical protein ACA910_012585 [Epithemia clementina (nom. ined.)]
MTTEPSDSTTAASTIPKEEEPSPIEEPKNASKSKNDADEGEVDSVAKALAKVSLADEQGSKTTKSDDDGGSSSSSHAPAADSEDEQQVQAPKALREFASWIKDGLVQNLLVVTGAGISVSAGIPDFRTPGTGLYDNLQKYNLPFPEAVFDLQYFSHYDPQPFITLASELWPTGETFKPTITHAFLTLLARKNLLLRVYSQNIDGLEHLAELPVDKLVECHGHFRTASCIRCRKQAADMEAIKDTILKKAQVPKCKSCRKGLVKPDIVFFGEGLPDRFFKLLPGDLNRADCCMVLGTSLLVAPVSQIPEQVGPECKRILLNRELVGPFESSTTKHDVYQLDDCDDSIRTLAQLLGWLEELEQLHRQVSSNLNTKSKR